MAADGRGFFPEEGRDTLYRHVVWMSAVQRSTSAVSYRQVRNVTENFE